MNVAGKPYRTVWMEGNTVRIINQLRLPHFFELMDLPDHQATAKAIRTMAIRGAGAIGGAGGYGMAQVVLEAPESSDFMKFILKGAETLRKTRPTAQNLFYAIDRVVKRVEKIGSVKQAKKAAVEEAVAIADEDASSCEMIGKIGADLIKDGMRIMTHCNAGWLAFVDWGTALAPVYFAKRQGKKVFVFADETRPRNQGSSLTAWELMNEGVDFAILADNASGIMMKRGEIDLVITGSDRIASSGDTANKIGTYEKAVLAHENGIPFYIAAPTSTIDPNCASGDDIPIEERSQDEVLYAYGLKENGEYGRVRIAPRGAKARNPAFDVTPGKYIHGIITQNGIFPPKRILESIKDSK
ncbi:MAG: S-methyl-5-thioribose-1-phosphate isomerase [Thermodesulfobacteriota bacterium]|jgi:S-methyl-5-thioribose-1-phosphate isomerase